MEKDMEISERYQKALVTVAMKLRREEDIKKNGLLRFTKNEKDELIAKLKELFETKENLLVLKIKRFGFRSEHIEIKNKTEFYKFLENVDEVFGEDNEIWVVTSSVINCYRCRIYLGTSNLLPDKIEMAKSTDDHVLDHIGNGSETKYVCFEKKHGNLSIVSSTISENEESECREIINDIYSKFTSELNAIKQDMELLGISGISLDCRVNDGYDFHDFDVSYGDVKKVIDFYVPAYLEKTAKNK